MIKHIRRWNIWRKHNRNNRFYKILVLLGFTRSPTFELELLPADYETIEHLLDIRVEKIKKGE